MIADEDQRIRSFLRLILEDGGYPVVGEADGRRDTVAETIRLGPDVVVLDERIAWREGSRATRLIRGSLPDARIVVCCSLPSSDPSGLEETIVKDDIAYLPLMLDRLVDRGPSLAIFD